MTFNGIIDAVEHVSGRTFERRSQGTIADLKETIARQRAADPDSMAALGNTYILYMLDGTTALTDLQNGRYLDLRPETYRQHVERTWEAGEVSGGATASTAPTDGAAADVEGFTHHYADANGIRLHYVSGGSGPAVVLLHGWPLTWREWRDIMPALAEAGFTVIAPDLRGLGDSERPSHGYDKKTVADDIRHIVRDLGFDSIDLVGTDIGMMVAVSWALHHPTEIRRLVLAESLIPGFGLEELMNPATGGYWHFGFHAQVDLATMLTEGKEAKYLGNNWKMFSPLKGITADDREEYLRTYGNPDGMRAGFRHYAAMLDDGKANPQGIRPEADDAGARAQRRARHSTGPNARRCRSGVRARRTRQGALGRPTPLPPIVPTGRRIASSSSSIRPATMKATRHDTPSRAARTRSGFQSGDAL